MAIARQKARLLKKIRVACRQKHTAAAVALAATFSDVGMSSSIVARKIFGQLLLQAHTRRTLVLLGLEKYTTVMPYCPWLLRMRLGGLTLDLPS